MVTFPPLPAPFFTIIFHRTKVAALHVSFNKGEFFLQGEALQYFDRLRLGVKVLRACGSLLKVFGEGLVVPVVDQGGEPLAGGGVVEVAYLLEQGGAVARRQLE